MLGMGGAPPTGGPEGLLVSFPTIGAERSLVTAFFSRAPLVISPSRAPFTPTLVVYIMTDTACRGDQDTASGEVGSHTLPCPAAGSGLAEILPGGGGGGGAGGPPFAPGIGGGGGGGGGGMIWVGCKDALAQQRLLRYQRGLFLLDDEVVSLVELRNRRKGGVIVV